MNETYVLAVSIFASHLAAPISTASAQGFDWSKDPTSMESPLNPLNPFNSINPTSPWYKKRKSEQDSLNQSLSRTYGAIYEFNEVRGYSPATSIAGSSQFIDCHYGFITGNSASSGLWYTSLLTDLRDAAMQIFKLGDHTIGLYFFAEISYGPDITPGFKLKAAYDPNKRLDFSGKYSNYRATYRVKDRDRLHRNAAHMLKIFRQFGKPIGGSARDENCPKILNPRIENQSTFAIDLRWDRQEKRALNPGFISAKESWPID